MSQKKTNYELGCANGWVQIVGFQSIGVHNWQDVCYVQNYKFYE